MNDYYLLILLVFFSCSTENKTIFGGKILNPTSDNIILYKSEVQLNESVIDENGNFKIILDSIKAGLYSFFHEPEFQYLILDKNDSLIVRLNTLDFDESLVYSGVGSAKNNFLMDIFLRNEQHNDILNLNLNNTLIKFKKLSDSLNNSQSLLYSKFLSDNEVSRTTNKIIQSAILYPYLAKFHSFIIRNNINNIDQSILFKNYEDFISFNEDYLAYFKPYIDFLYLHIYNEVKNSYSYDSMLDFNLIRLKQTDKLIQSHIIKSRVLRFHAIGYLLQREKDSLNKLFLDRFMKVSKNKLLNMEINSLYLELKN